MFFSAHESLTPDFHKLPSHRCHITSSKSENTTQCMGFWLKIKIVSTYFTINLAIYI